MNKVARAFHAIQRKIDPRWRSLGYYSDIPQAVRMSKDFRTFVKSGYKDSDTLYKCISYIIRNGSAIPSVLYTDHTMKKKIDSHDLLDLLKKPNVEQSGVSYLESVLGYKLLSGNSFQYAIRVKENGPPNELWALRPDKMQIKIARNRGIIGYQYETMDEMISPENIAHNKYWNPDDDDQPGFGLSPLEAAALNIDMQANAKKWNLALLQNSARPPGIWKLATTLGKTEREKLEQRVNEKFAGAKGAGKAPLFDGGLDWKPTGLAPAQMDFLDSLKYNGGSIANILNIAPQLIGDTSSTTFDNMEQAKIFSYTEAIFPELDDIYAMWNIWLLPMYPDLKRSGAYLYYDKESVEVIQGLIQKQKDAKAQRAQELWMDGLCLQNEARELAGLPATPEGDVYRIGNILIPKGKLQEYAEQSLTEPAGPPMPVAEPLNLLPAISPPGNTNPQNAVKPVDNTKPINKRRARKAEQEPNYKVWQCAAGACEFCMQNDGVVVGIDEDFPNGCSTPDDCHKYCKCEAYTLYIPDNADTDDWSALALAAAYGIALLASRHDKDVEAAKEEADEDDDEEKMRPVEETHAEFMERFKDIYEKNKARREKSRVPKGNTNIRAKEAARDEYRKFMEGSLK